MGYVVEKTDTKISYELLTPLVEHARNIADGHRAVKIKHVYQAALRAFFKLSREEQLELLRSEVVGDVDPPSTWEDVTPPAAKTPKKRVR